MYYLENNRMYTISVKAKTFSTTDLPKCPNSGYLDIIRTKI